MAKTAEIKKEEKRRLRPATRRLLVVFAIETALVLVLAAIVAHTFFSSIHIQENSMSPTIESGDTVLVNRAAYLLRGVKRGDLIAYRISGRMDSAVHVKRVIALPGETVQIQDGLILINGTTYMETDEFPAITKAGLAEDPITLGSDEYFVLGDNRNNSEDSRFADVGNIQRDDVIGRVWFRTAPRAGIGFLK